MALDGISGSGPLATPPRRPAVAASTPPTGPVPDSLALSRGSAAPRTLAEARREADAIFYNAASVQAFEARVKAAEANDRVAFDAAGYVEVGLGRIDFREVLKDPEHVNRDRLHRILRAPEKEAAARRQVAANAPFERAALEGLPDAARAQFQAVAGLLGADPTSRLALQWLLLDGQLASQDTPGQSLLANLAAIARPGATHAALPAAELLADLVHEIRVPAAISQQDASTCSATTLQILLAREAPAEYVRLVRGLASPAGVVAMQSGAMLVREPGSEQAQPFLATVEGQDVETPDTRSHPARVFQAAVMEYANGEAGYDPRRDRHTTGLAGLSADMIARALAGLGRPASRVHDVRAGLDARIAEAQAQLSAARAETDVLKSAQLSIQAIEGYEAIEKEIASRRRAMRDDVLAALGRGEPVPVAVAGWRGVEVAPGDTRYVGAHALLAVRVEGEAIVYVNPHGTEERMSQAAFLERVGAALIP